MKVLLLRHGQTDANLEHRYLGALDPSLNQTGIDQARLISSKLPRPLTVVATSPLRRTRETAEVICEPDGLKPIELAEFRERNVGVFEGLTQQEAKERFPELWARQVTRGWDRAPTDGETIEDVFHRVSAGIKRLEHWKKNPIVVLVAHGFVAKVVRALVWERRHDFFDWQLDNGEVLTLELEDNFNFKPTPIHGEI